MRAIYAILDLLTNDIGGLWTSRADAAAIRMFHDILSDDSRDNLQAKHPEDYVLICLGHVQDDPALRIVATDAYREVLTGKQWVAARAADKPIKLEA